MSQYKDDSDFEVCLTSSDYNRILSAQKNSKKDRQESKKIQQHLQNQIKTIETEKAYYQTQLKSQSQQINTLIVQCLRLKKLRLTHQDQIRAYKQFQLKLKQSNLNDLSISISQNKEMKQQMITDQNLILQLTEKLQKFKEEKIAGEKNNLVRVNQLQSNNDKLIKRTESLEKELAYNYKRIQLLEQKVTKSEQEISNNKEKIEIINKENNELTLSNDSLVKTVKEEIQKVKQIQTANQEFKRTIKEMNLKILNQFEEVKKISLQLNQSNKKYAQLQQISKSNSFDQNHKFSSRIYEALQWTKQGSLPFSQLSVQIQNILTFQKQYEDIIHQNIQKINNLQQQVQSLQSVNKDLILRHTNIVKQFASSSMLLKQLSQMKISKQDSHTITQNIVLKQQIDKLKLKLDRVTKQFDESVPVYQYKINDLSVKNQKDNSQIEELKNEVQALKLYQQFYMTQLVDGVKKFQQKVLQMRKESNFLNPQRIMTTLIKSLPKLSR